MSSIRNDLKETKPHFAKRIVWRVVNATLFRMTGGTVGWPLRRTLLRAFGATIHRDAYIYARCRIFAPFNLSVGRSLIGPRTDLYSKGHITIGDQSVVSQGTTICTASHDITSLQLPLVVRDVVIGDNVWVAAEAFVGPGVTIGDGAVVGARSAVFDDVEPWAVMRGNPAVKVKERRVVP